MKKMLSLVLCLMLCLPVLATAEDITQAPELYTIDFGTFTIDLSADDYYEVADELVDNALYAIVYPNYDPTVTPLPNINIVWSQADATAEIQAYGAEKFAQLILDISKPQFEAMNIKMSNEQVLSAAMEDNVYASITCCELDYTAAGVDLITPQYQMQVYYCLDKGGTYMFTLTAASMELLETLSSYLDRISFK